MKDAIVFGTTIQNYIGVHMKMVDHLKQQINSDEDLKYNIEKLKDGMMEYGITGINSNKDLLYPSAREILLFSVHLYQTLPHYIPKTVVEFTCLLDEKVTKHIVLTNPSPKVIYYWVRLQAHKDFSIESDSIKIEPKQTVQFPVVFMAKISTFVTGRITFRNKRDGGVQAAALVFDLKSNIIGRVSREIREIKNVRLYELGTIEIPVSNPFENDADFTIKIEAISTHTEVVKKKPKNAKEKKDADGKVIPEDDRKFVIPSFFCRQDKIKIKRNSNSKVQIFYLPMTLDTHKCHIIFMDERVGEFQYELIGTPEMPASTETLTFNSHLDSNLPYDIPISLKNTHMNMASFKLKEKVRDLQKKEFVRDDMFQKIMELQEDSTFDVDITPPNFISYPISYVIDRNKGGQGPNDDDRQSAKGNQPLVKSVVTVLTEGSLKDNPQTPQDVINKLTLMLNFKVPVKNYPVTLTMKNKTATDIRIYEINITIFPKVVKAILELNTPARIPIEQNIPIINTQDKDCPIKVTFTDIKNGTCFTYQNQFTAKKKGTSIYPLRFYPIWIMDAEAKLILNNPLTNETFEYD